MSATMSELAVMGVDGDTKIIWNRRNREEVDSARATFDRLRAKNFAAFSVRGEKGEKGEQIFKFDENAERIILVPPFAGGEA